MILTPEQEDRFLEMILVARSVDEFNQAVVAFVKTLPDKSKVRMSVALRDGENWLRRRAIRRTDYVCRDQSRRSWRAGTPFSYGDRRMLDWARSSDSMDRKQPYTDSYAAILLGRSPEEIAGHCAIDAFVKASVGVDGIKPLFS
jgi:hypothetical protein